MEFLGLLAVCAAVVGTEFLENIWGKIEIFNNIWTFISYHNRIDENRQTLKRKLEALCSVEEDVNRTLETAELQNGKKPKREVENWLSNVQRIKNDVQCMEQKVGDRRYLLGPWWEARVSRKICEVKELYEQGNFDSLLLDVHETIGNKLLTTNLVGHNSNGGVLERIWAYLMNDMVLRIGVYGAEGVGKTEIMMHIHNQLLQNVNSGNASFDNVYWVTLSDNFSIHKLQDDISKEVGLDLFYEEDTRKRAGRLYKGVLRRKKCVLILDGVPSYFDQDKVGIPTEPNSCKLIITTRTLKLCRRMGCQEQIEIKPLPDREAENLFKEKVGFIELLPQNVEEIAKLIVKECGGLPGKIISIAEMMKGVDDINEWRNTLYTLQECRGLRDRLEKLLE